MRSISCDNLACGYGTTAILENLTLTVPQGRFVCLIGANGIGKSTLARTLAGLQPHMAGTVRIGGQELDALSPIQRARLISVVLTGIPLVGYLTVRGFVGIGRHPYTGTLGRMSPTDEQAVTNAMELVGISHLADRSLTTVSDGERQRAAIARALAQAAAVMILDEPTAFLDVESRALIMTTLRTLAHTTGRSVLATSHDIDLVLHVADELWIMTPEREVIAGAPEDLALSGALSHAFPGHVMDFDLQTGGFRLPRPDGSAVAVRGSGVRHAWTVRALERIGLRVDADTAEPLVTVDDDSWTLNNSGESTRYRSLGAIVEALRSSAD